MDLINAIVPFAAWLFKAPGMWGWTALAVAIFVIECWPERQVR